MLKQQARLISIGVFLLDLCLVALAFVAAHWLRSELLPRLFPSWFSGPLYSLRAYLPLLPLAIPLWAFALWTTETYRSHRTVPLKREAAALIRMTVLSTVLWTLAIFVFRFDVLLLDGDRISRTWIALFAAVSFLLLMMEKMGLRITSRYVRQRGFNYRTLVIVGTSQSARALYQAIAKHAYWGFKVLSFVRTPRETKEQIPDRTPPEVQTLESIGELSPFVETHPVDDVFFAVSPREMADLEELFPQPAGARNPHPGGIERPTSRSRAHRARGAREHPPAELLAHADQSATAAAQTLGRRCTRQPATGDRPADGAGGGNDDQDHLDRGRALSTDPLRPQRPALHSVQVPDHGRRRSRASPRPAASQRDGRTGFQAQARPARDLARALSAQVLTRRDPAAVERAARRHEPGRPATADPGRGRGVLSLAAATAVDEARSDLSVADQRPQRARLRSVDGARSRVHRFVVAIARLQDSAEDDSGGAHRARRLPRPRRALDARSPARA